MLILYFYNNNNNRSKVFEFYNALDKKVKVKTTEEEVEMSKKREKPYVEVISPNGGEKWEIGKTYKIRWSFEGVPAEGAGSAFAIDLFKGNDLDYKNLFVV